MKIEKIISIILFAIIFNGINAQDIDTISSIDAQKILSQNKNLTIIDARTPAEFAEGHVKGAININVADANIDELLKAQLSKKDLFIYCRTSRRSGIVVTKLVNMNFAGHIYFMNDGIMGWTNNKFELER